jgi:hypothetical protein
VSRTRNRLRGMTGKGNVSEASALRIVNRAELKRLKGSRPKKGWGAGSGDINGRLTHVQSPPGVQRHPNPVCRYNLRNVVSLLRSRPARAGPSRPSASAGEGVAGKGPGGSEGSAVIVEIGVQTLPRPERVLTSQGCDRTRKLGQTVNGGSVYNE